MIVDLEGELQLAADKLAKAEAESVLMRDESKSAWQTGAASHSVF